jgi:hypothetical protein
VPESASLLLLLSFLSSFTGMGWLALGIESHWQQVRHDALVAPRRRRLRILGSGALAVSLFSSFAANHASMAPLVWIMESGFAAFLVAMLLAWRPRVIGLLAPRALL